MTTPATLNQGVTAHSPTACAPATFPHGLRRPLQSLSLGLGRLRIAHD